MVHCRSCLALSSILISHSQYRTSTYHITHTNSHYNNLSIFHDTLYLHLPTAYLKLGKELDTPVNSEKFIFWAVDRFKDSRTVATHQALQAVFESAYQ